MGACFSASEQVVVLSEEDMADIVASKKAMQKEIDAVFDKFWSEARSKEQETAVMVKTTEKMLKGTDKRLAYLKQQPELSNK